MFGKFLSTPSARRATSSGCAIRTPCWYFYPRPPRGGRPPGTMPETLSIHFYPRPPRGGRLQTCLFFFSFKHFYPRPPRGGRRQLSQLGAVAAEISIHALREEGDSFIDTKAQPFFNFYPRPPRGGRRRIALQSIRAGQFLSTPSARRATAVYAHFNNTLGFLSTPSARRATRYAARIAGSAKFLSTPSARRATAKTETKSLFSNKLYNILHEFRRALIYNGSKSYPNHAK